MNTGKISESILKRSVLKEIKIHRDEITKGAGVGTDCAFFVPKENTAAVFSTDTAIPRLRDGIYFSIYKIAANIAAAGGRAIAVQLAVLLPENETEDTIKEIMRHADRACKELQIEVAGGHTEVSSAVTEPVVTVTGIGEAEISGAHEKAAATEDLDLVVTKWIGLEGTAIASREGKTSLLTRYPERMVEEAASFIKYLDVYPEAALAVKSGVCRMHDISRGGILAALWDMAASAGVGLDIDLKKIPIRQETVEICEHFGLNPYGMISGGSLLIAVKNGESLVEELLQHDIYAAVIGHTTKSNDKIIRNEEDIRYLDRPAQDEIYKFLGGMNPCN